MASDYFGGIEAGGTKFNCIVATGPDDVLHHARIPTTSPQETLAQVIAFFRSCGVSLRAVGIGSFGPVDPDPRSPTLSPARRSWAGATPISSARSAAR
jgi:fructokinase